MGYQRALSTFAAPVNHGGHPALALPLAVPGAAPQRAARHRCR